MGNWWSKDLAEDFEVVIHKRNRTATMLTVRLDQIEELAQAVASLRGKAIWRHDGNRTNRNGCCWCK